MWFGSQSARPGNNCCDDMCCPGPEGGCCPAGWKCCNGVCDTCCDPATGGPCAGTCCGSRCRNDACGAIDVSVYYTRGVRGCELRKIDVDSRCGCRDRAPRKDSAVLSVRSPSRSERHRTITTLLKRSAMGLVVVLWAASIFAEARWVSPSGTRVVGLSQGCLTVAIGYTSARFNHCPGSRSAMGRELTTCFREWLSLSICRSREPGVRWLPGLHKALSRSGTLTSRTLQIPLYLLLVPLAIPEAYRTGVRIRRRARRKRGQCSACGYDLRGSAGRCPECGVECGTEQDTGT